MTIPFRHVSMDAQILLCFKDIFMGIFGVFNIMCKINQLLYG
jgi:hypothetical protein